MSKYRCGLFSVDLDREEVRAGDRPVGLPRKNFEVLRELVRAEGKLVQRDDLTRAVWPDTVVEEATLRQNIYTLRSMLREIDSGREYVETVPKTGYRMAVPVERLETISADSASPIPHRRVPRYARPAVTAILILAVAVFLWLRLPAPRPPQPAPEQFVSQAWEILDQRDGRLFPTVEWLLDQAIRDNSAYVPAHEARAVLFALERREALAEAEAAQVQKLDPTTALPQAIRGFDRMMYHWDWSAAAHNFAVLDRVGCRQPVCRQWRALYLALTGNSVEAVREANFALEIDAARLAPRAQLAQVLYWAGRYDDAISEARTVLEAGGVWTHARYHLWKSLLLKGDRLAAAEVALRSRDGAWYRLGHGDELHDMIADPAAGSQPEFWTRLLQAEERRGVGPYFLAELAMAAGDRDRALAELEASLKSRDFFLPFARRDPLFGPLHGESRYEAVMQAVGL